MGNKSLRWLVISAFIFKSILAGITELNNDEVYYRLYALKLQWNYFDHPPMIAVLLKLFTFNLFFQNDFFLRLGILVCSALSTWLVYLIGKRINDEQTGLLAAFLFIASPYCSIIAGLLLIPDGPQLVWWLWSVLLMLKITGSEQNNAATRKRLLLLGLTIGCCVLSKVHGIFLWVGFFTYILLYRRSLLANPFLYYSMLISAVVISPILFWNLSNHFISYRYHSNRVHFFNGFQADSFLREIVGEVLYNNPIVIVLLVLALAAFARKRIFLPLPAQRLLFLLAFPLIAVVIIISLFNDTLPHWTGPAYTTLIPFTAAWLRSRQKMSNLGKLPAAVKWAVAFTGILLIPAVGAIKALPLNIGNKQWQQLGSGDPTLDMNGFNAIAPRLDSLYQSDIKKGLIHNDPFLLADYWFPAAHIDYYIARPYGFRFLAFGGGAAIHQYAWINADRPFLQPGDDAYFIAVSNYFNPPAVSLAAQFDTVLPPVALTQYRGGVAVRNFFVYRMRGYKGGLPRNGVME